MVRSEDFHADALSLFDDLELEKPKGKDTNRKIRMTFFIYIYAMYHSSTFEFSRVFHVRNVLKCSLANNKIDLTQVNFV